MERILAAFKSGGQITDQDLQTLLRLLASNDTTVIRARVFAVLGEMVKSPLAPGRPDRLHRAGHCTVP